MNKSYLLDPIQILRGPNQTVTSDAVLIVNRHIKAFGQRARDLAYELKIDKTSAEKLFFAPCLVDPHSVLEDYLNGKAETLWTLMKKAANAGYGQIALLPKASPWRDKPEYLYSIKNLGQDVLIHLWGGFSQKGAGEKLTSHKDLIDHGAVGLADDDWMIPIELLKKGLILNETKEKPILLAPRDLAIQGHGLVRESVEALRAGWHQDPVASETIPLGTLLELQKQHPSSKIRLMNLSTAEGVNMLKKSSPKPMASVFWWHLVADQSTVTSTDIGIRVSPSLGSSNDRESLKKALQERILTGVAVHNISLDDAETKKPFSEIIPGISGYHLVLPSLWQELIKKSKWSVEQLWEAISFGPSKILSLPPEELKVGSNRWLLFDPDQKWIQTRKYQEKGWETNSNQPWEGIEMIGKIIDCGLS
ncbi:MULTISPECIES: dihydroorotase [Prochlorococcus]|uniref:Dihydroorotase n=1 Tax=Prochlorococcus marinus (strain SARG / CCMP1375 / SS120) TaxID=167539 RepID=Q7VD69_PROMA|nr:MULTISPECIES: dihydroorotase [Prochlorococcus]AAP99559.1 Dihydroorotase [Prochlorococcus marinus subsp. marinus str. CCMP1375]KGG11167.1 Dihydroorotase [Prochlorococcus marinus str. LG]KGG21505.1 Dihydroorotase [Prochlorococcus marinus str. SS2]KGG23150.1 Dihydroorotase [Prochlorococcus marinus str. SS35]KGG33861.1 Dihydroorotase [Prochlorococcus marinus str. SS51]